MSGDAAHMAAMRAAAQKKLQQRNAPPDSKGKGFKAIAKKIAAKQGVSNDRGAAILAASSRNASAEAKKKNPALNKVK
jgi:hypothetical protein